MQTFNENININLWQVIGFSIKLHSGLYEFYSLVSKAIFYSLAPLVHKNNIVFTTVTQKQNSYLCTAVSYPLSTYM